MINERDVIRMKVPYPSVDSGLAVAAHMYICKKSVNHNYEYIKCQTLKPYMLNNNLLRHYHDEKANLDRNPFKHTTRIDCDKLFLTHTVEYSDDLKTQPRSDVCDDLFRTVIDEILADGVTEINVNEDQLQNLNIYITSV